MAEIRSTFLALAGALVLAKVVFAFSRRRPHYPPGPKGWPLVGNVTDMPRKEEWLTFTEWARAYGSLVYLDLLGQPVVIINSVELERELFDARGHIYSGRPSRTMAQL